MFIFQHIALMPLEVASAKITGGGWASNHFAAIRSEAISSSSAICSMAMAIGSILAAFQLIKMYYDMASDEQHGGFGGIRAMDILRPISMLFIIMGMGVITPLLDSACNGVSSALVANMNGTVQTDDDKLNQKLEELEDELNKSKSQLYEEAKAEVSQRHDGLDMNELYREADKALKDAGVLGDKQSISLGENGEVTKWTLGWGGNNTSVTYKNFDEYLSSEVLTKDGSKTVAELLGGNENAEAVRQKVEKSKAMSDETNDINRVRNEGRKIIKIFSKGGNIIGNLATWLFNIFFVVMMAFADITLCLLAIFGPIAAALSVLESWKATFKSWIGSYIEVSMWKPVGCSVCWIVVKAKHAITGMGILASEYGGMDPNMAKSTLWAAIGVEALILIAGVKTLLLVPSITNSILSIGSSSLSSETGVGAAAGGVMGSMASGAKNAGGKAFGAAGKVLGKLRK